MVKTQNIINSIRDGKKFNYIFKDIVYDLKNMYLYMVNYK